MRLEWKLTCVIICQWWGIIMSMFFYRKFEGNNWHAATTMQRKQIFPQVGNKSERLLNLSLKCMQRHTNKLSVTFLINNSTSCCWEKRGGGVKKAQSTTGTSMIDSGLRLLICSPYKNSHVACELQIIVKNTQSLTYTCTYNKVVIKCTYKKKVKFVFILDIFWMICSASLLFFFPRAW